MSPEMFEKARKLQAAPGFCWEPGMRVKTAHGLARVIRPSPARASSWLMCCKDEPYFICGIEVVPDTFVCDPSTVDLDLNDPATLGCLVSLFRKRYGRNAHIAAGCDAEGEFWVSRIASLDFPGVFSQGRRHPTEIDALLSAFEAAP